jgi:hypothetical protein
MSQIIAAAVPLIISPDRWSRNTKFDEKYLVPGFLDNYSAQEAGSTILRINEDLLLRNYKDFLDEFYGFIGESLVKCTGMDNYQVPEANTLDEFREAFDEMRSGRVPIIYERPSTFSTLGCQCDAYWIFYMGSSDAYLEDYSTLRHLENILAKAMKNPLAKAVKFGMFG